KKLYTFCAGHAAAAYFGALKGYRYVHSAIRDPEIRSAVLSAMEEGQRGLEQRYGPELAGDGAELEAIIARFENAALTDPVSRGGSPTDRARSFSRPPPSSPAGASRFRARSPRKCCAGRSSSPTKRTCSSSNRIRRSRSPSRASCTARARGS